MMVLMLGAGLCLLPLLLSLAVNITTGISRVIDSRLRCLMNWIPEPPGNIQSRRIKSGQGSFS